ncbi:unnamed protein product [Auanema sp. JU1783]|nr:unnamed protein product [Auanema sp. JU1783]
MVQYLEEAKRALTLYHFTNLLLSLVFLFLKGVPSICEYLFTWEDEEEGCMIDYREREILIFLAIVIVMKGRKATNWLHYLNNVFFFAKVANVFLFSRADPIMGIVYFIVCIVFYVVFPEPAFNGPEKITYFTGTELYDELQKNKSTTWVIMFYATWSQDCKHVNPVFAELSEKFTLPNLKFGKLDLGRSPKEAERFRVNAHPTSRQLPTVSLYSEGKEVRRRPVVNEKRRAVPFVFSKDNCILEFDLYNLHKECKEKLSTRTKKAMEKEKKNE